MKSNGASILVVDDTPANLKVLVQILENNGYRPRPVPSGHHALRAVEYELPDLILMDINMPMLDGIQTCAMLKSNDRYRSIPVIFVSALTDTFNKIKAFDAGGVDYVTKPFNAKEVIARVENHLRIRDRHSEMAENHRQLQELEELRDGLVSMVIHDMRSPLLVVRSALGLLLHNLGDVMDRESKEDIDDALAGANKLTTMIDNLLDMSRLEDGDMVVRIEKCNLKEVVDSVIEDLSIPANANANDLTIVSPTDSPYAALKFTQEDGEICVSIEGGKDKLGVSGQDGLAGTSSDVDGKISKAFDQMDDKTPGKFDASRAGLTFCLSDLPPEFWPNRARS
jgi:DNA-binding response OmpR family regulator